MIAVPAPVLLDNIKLLKYALPPVIPVEIVKLGTKRLVKYPCDPVIAVAVRLLEIKEVVVSLIILAVC